MKETMLVQSQTRHKVVSQARSVAVTENSQKEQKKGQIATKISHRSLLRCWPMQEPRLRRRYNQCPCLNPRLTSLNISFVRIVMKQKWTNQCLSFSGRHR